MCYHSLYLFLSCGHAVPSTEPVRTAECSLGSMRGNDLSPERQGLDAAVNMMMMPSPHEFEVAAQMHKLADKAENLVDDVSEEHQEWEKSLPYHERLCRNILAHPMHTFRINTLCRPCTQQREKNLASFETRMIAESVERSLCRSPQSRNEPLGGGAAMVLTRTETRSDTGRKRISRIGSGRGVIPLRIIQDSNPEVTREDIIEDDLVVEPLVGKATQMHQYNASHYVDNAATAPSMSPQASRKRDSLISWNTSDYTWPTLNNNVARDYLGRNLKGMNKIMGWNSSREDQEKNG